MAETDQGTTTGHDANYALNGGTLLVDGISVIGSAGVAEFVHTGDGRHQVGGNMIVGSQTTSDGTYIMRDGNPVLDVTGNLVLGLVSGSKAEFILDAGIVTVTGDTNVIAKPPGGTDTYTFNQSGGEHNASRLIITPDGSDTGVSTPVPAYLLSDGVLSVSNEIIGEGGRATFRQTGGTHNVVGTLTLGTDRLIGPQGQGSTYWLDEGELNVSGNLVVGSPLADCNLGCGSLFSQRGSSIVKVRTSVRIGADGARDGNYTMSGDFAHLEVGEFDHTGSIIIGGASSEPFTNSGALIVRTGNLVTVNGGDGSVFVHHNGFLHLDGGVLNGFRVVVPRTSPASTLAIPISSAIDEIVVNDGVIKFSGDPTGRISGGVRNNGTIEVTATTAQIDDRLVNNGELTSNGSATTLLEELIVNTSGWITAEAGDQFLISGNFENHSEQNIQWDTDIASLTMNSGASQDMYLAGLDFGDILQGYTDNFSWGELHIGSGTTLNLFDGNATPGAGL
jgi:hypothetical protein